MIRVGIITLFRYNNYGTMLQALALQEAIKKRSYSCEIIDYTQKQSRLEQILARLKRLPMYAMQASSYYKLYRNREAIEVRSREFNCFLKRNLSIGSPKYSTNEELIDHPPHYDLYIVGSDQTWNDTLKSNSDAFYLNFLDHRSRTGSYAPSIGIKTLTPTMKECVRKKIERIQYLSCREESGSQQLSECTPRTVTTVLDPTFLLNANEWTHFMDRQDVSEPYILEYFLGQNKKNREWVGKLAKLTGYRIVSLPVTHMDMLADGLIKKYVGPGGFLSLVKNAMYVCTDSFHGVAFSINFKKDFFAFVKFKQTDINQDNSRIFDILERFQLMGRFIDTQDPNENCLHIDYGKIEGVRHELLQGSNSYLDKMLMGV